MNSLSWYIYLAGVADAVGRIAAFFAICGGFAYLVFMITMAFYLGDVEIESKDRDSGLRVRSGVSWLAAPILIVTIPVAIFMPTKQTMVLIAGSELGEMAIKSEQVQGVVNPGMDLIKAWIAKETDKLKKAVER